LSTLESYRSTFYYFTKHSGLGLALTFRFLMALKLVLINVPLSLIATAFTLGTVPRHVRRLRMRAVLASWHLCGCPDSWGMRLVSDLRGFRRVRDGGVLARAERIVPEDATDDFLEFLRHPTRAIALGKVIVESRTATNTGEDVLVSFPRPLFSSSGDGRPDLTSEALVRLRLFRPGARTRLLSFWHVPAGVLAFEDALDTDDVESADGKVIAAGARSTLSFERYSFVAYSVSEMPAGWDPASSGMERLRGAPNQFDEPAPGANGSNGSSNVSTADNQPDRSRRS
jgi:hypothetical protein